MDGLITLFKVIIGVIILCGVPGVIMGTISSIRAGQLKPREEYLRFKKFAQQKFFNRTTWIHIKSYWMYYGMAIILIGSYFG